MLKKKKSKEVNEMSKVEVIEEALFKNVSGGTNTCANDAGPGCQHDTCYDGVCNEPDLTQPDPTPGENQTQ